LFEVSRYIIAKKPLPQLGDSDDSLLTVSLGSRVPTGRLKA
jgi:hypothetical protein